MEFQNNKKNFHQKVTFQRVQEKNICQICIIIYSLCSVYMSNSSRMLLSLSHLSMEIELVLTLSHKNQQQNKTISNSPLNRYVFSLRKI